MPPKPKFTREEIIDAAYEIMEENGIDAVAAREVAKKLGTTPGPIFTYFEGMDELKHEVLRRAVREVNTYLEGAVDYRPAFKEFGMRWIRFAKEHPNAYSLVFYINGPMKNLEDDENSARYAASMELMEQDVANAFEITREEATDVIRKMSTFSQGIASICITTGVDIPDDMINKEVGDVCLSIVAGIKIRNGNLDVEKMKRMLDNSFVVPQKIVKEKKDI